MDKTLYYMQKAIEQAEIAAAENEVPVGAVIVRNDEIVATGRNRREQGKNAFFMPKPTQYTMPVKSLAVGDCGTVKFM